MRGSPSTGCKPEAAFGLVQALVLQGPYVLALMAASCQFSGKPRNHAISAYKVFKNPLVRAGLQEIQETGKQKAIEAVKIA
jgi:hypothetical protein